MATTKQYWLQLRAMSRAISTRFGVNLQYADPTTRAIMALVGAQSAMLLKILIDKGVITEEDVQQAWLAAKDEDWEEEPMNPVPDGWEDPDAPPEGG